MRSVGVVLRAEIRRRWFTWLALALLIAATGGTVVAGVAAAQRTASAFPSFVARDGYDAAVISTNGFARHLGSVAGVGASTRVHFYGSGDVNVDGRLVSSSDVSVSSLPSPRRAESIQLISGQLPVGPRDVVVGYSMAEKFGLHAGSTLSVPFVAPGATPPAVNEAPATHYAFRLTLHVVGVAATIADFPSTSPSYSLYASPAFERRYGTKTASVSVTFVRLSKGARGMLSFQSTVNHLATPGLLFTLDIDATTSAVEGSIHPQVIGWWLFALFAGLAGLALVGQALVRQSLVEGDDFPTLATLGFRPGQLFLLGLARSAAIGVAGALGALALAYALSPLAPVGEARAAESTRGFTLSGTLFLLGAVCIVGAVLLLAALPAWRRAQHRGTEQRAVTTATRSSVATMVRSLGAAPSVFIGVRHGLERGRGRASAPVAMALVGTSLAVAAVVVTSIFGASFTHLVSTPSLYGENWQVDLSNLSASQVRAVAASLQRNPAVTRVGYGVTGKYITVGGVAVESLLVTIAKGPMPFSLASGHYPRGNRQLLVGETTLAAAHAHVGQRVTVSIDNDRGSSFARTFTVSGAVVIPPSFQIGGLGEGAVLTISAAEALACEHAHPEGPCVAAVNNTLAHVTWGMAIATANTPAGRATRRQLDRRFAPFLTERAPPTSLVNFGQAVDFPLLLTLTFAIFGAAMLVHLLVVVVTRRRRQFAVLKVLGFTRRQVGSTVLFQALTIAVVGVLVGIPLGLAAGALVWRVFVENLGAVPATVFPVPSMVVLVVATVVCAVTLAAVPARLVARIQPAVALREG